MILTEFNFGSETLGMRAHLDVLLPQPPLHAETKPAFRVLYLLHGRSDDQSGWLRWAPTERYVDGLNLAVVMPYVHLSFYTNMLHGGRYWDFVSEEVPALVRQLLPVSTQRADTFAAGLSMGGYGAFKLALAHPDRYAAAASLSGVMDVYEYMRNADDIPRDDAWRREMYAVFGEAENIPGGSNDLFHLANSAAQSGQPPRLFQCCGTEDHLLSSNRAFRDYLSGLPLDLTYREAAGIHDWNFWDPMFRQALQWMFA